MTSDSTPKPPSVPDSPPKTSWFDRVTGRHLVIASNVAIGAFIAYQIFKEIGAEAPFEPEVVGEVSKTFGAQVARAATGRAPGGPAP